MIRIFGHYVDGRTLRRMGFDACLVLALILLELSALGSSASLMSFAAGASVLSFATGVTAINSLSGLYSRADILSLRQLVQRALLALALALPLAFVLIQFVPVGQDPLLMQSLAAVGAVAVVARRAYKAGHHRNQLPGSRVMIFGSGSAANDVAQSLALISPSSRIVGFYPGPNESGSVIPETQRLSDRHSLTDTARMLRVDEIVVALAERRAGSMPLAELLDCKVSGMKVLDLASFFERAHGQIRIDHANAGWLVFGSGFRQGFYRSVLKRAFDILGSLFLIALSLPVMLIATVLIRLDSRGPVLYRQERTGLGGKSFMVAKFRSMFTDAESDGKPRWAATNDSRVTRVGQIIRRLRIDELPQFFNVLKGDMSLVGPRPERPFFVEQLAAQIPYFQLRHSVKPGITGWAQVRYQYGATVEDARQKLQYDLYYVKNNSLFLDTVILFKTIVVVLTGQGAR